VGAIQTWLSSTVLIGLGLRLTLFRASLLLLWHEATPKRKLNQDGSSPGSAEEAAKV
jgi:hypothetical protein